MWTHFWDMNSGGGTKEKWSHIYIEAPQHQAKIVFYNRFGHNPDRVSCTCCGNDYSIEDYETLEEASGFQRGCDYGYIDKEGNEIPKDQAWKSGKGLINGCTYKCFERQSKDYSFHQYTTIEEYKKQKDILIITNDEIKEDERQGEIPKQGYVWVD